MLNRITFLSETQTFAQLCTLHGLHGFAHDSPAFTIGFQMKSLDRSRPIRPLPHSQALVADPRSKNAREHPSIIS